MTQGRPPGCSRAGVDGTVQGRAPRKAWLWATGVITSHSLPQTPLSTFEIQSEKKLVITSSIHQLIRYIKN